jgi:hypothetical protein
MSSNCPIDDLGNPIPLQLSSNAGGNELDIRKWGAQRVLTCIYDVQQSIQEGIAAGPITPFNISGNTIPGSQV